MQEAVDSMRVLGGGNEKAFTFGKVSMSRAKGCVWLMVLLKVAVLQEDWRTRAHMNVMQGVLSTSGHNSDVRIIATDKEARECSERRPN